jgi:hypothetical protein
MECSFVNKNLFGLVENNLSQSDRTEIERHVSSCPQCAMVISEFRKTIGDIETDRAKEVNPFAGTRILQHIESAWSGQKARSYNAFFRVLQPVVLTFSLFLAVLIGFSLGKKGITDISAKTSADHDLQSIRSELFISDITDEDKTLFINP